MIYQQARKLIKTGDVIAICGNSLFSKITKIVQRYAGLGEFANITHCGVAWWVEGRLYIVEMDGRHNVLRPLSQYAHKNLELRVYRVADQDLMIEQFDDATRYDIAYSFLDLVKIGWRLIFGGACINTSTDDSMVCSEFVARWLIKAGWVAPSQLPIMPSPAELCAAFDHQVLVVK
jgi:hypothetical protein